MDCARRYAVFSNPPKVDLFLAVGERDEGQLPGFRNLTGLLANGSLPNIRFKSQVFAGEGHSSGVIAKTFLAGLNEVFRK